MACARSQPSAWDCMMLFSGKRNRRKAAETVALASRLAWLQDYRRSILLGAAVLSIAGVAWSMVSWLLDRPIQRAEIAGKFTQVQPLQVEQALEPFGTAGFVSIDLAKVKRAVQAIQWIDQVRVERAWPNGIRVFVTEQVAVARWGESGLLNTRGELFLPEARDLPMELPQLSGPEGTEAHVAKVYLDTYPRLLAVGLRLKNITLDARGAWDLVLTNGVSVRLGRQDVDARLERFIQVASPLIATRAGEVAYVDMRYSNGFAVGWGATRPAGSRPAAAEVRGNKKHA